MYAWRDVDQLGFIAVASVAWLNFNPYFIKKENEMESTLRLLYGKIGPNVTMYNDLLPRSTTSTRIDKETYSLYQQRNSKNAGTIYTEEDITPPFLPKYGGENFKKVYL